MSQPSWRLFRHGNGRWYVRARVAGRKVERSTGATDEGEASKWASAWASKAFDARKVAGARASEGAGVARSPAVDVVSHESPPAAPASSRAAEIAAKLRALAQNPHAPAAPSNSDPSKPSEPSSQPSTAASPASESVEPDDVIAPGDVDDDEDLGVEEAGEFLADAIAEGLVVGTVKAGVEINRARKPPRRANEPNETCVRYAREGLQFRLRRLLGDKTRLGPNAKIAVGLGGILVTMCWGAELAGPPAPAAAAAASSASSPAAPAEDADDVADVADGERQLAVVGGQVAAAGGRFR